METLFGIPPNSALLRFPGVCTDSVGVWLRLLCLEMKIMSSRLVNVSGRFCAWTDSLFKVISSMSLLLILVSYAGFDWKFSCFSSKL